MAIQGIASGIRAQLAYVAETTIGLTPTSPTTKRLRATSRNINLTKNLLESDEVSFTGQETDVRHGFNQIGGSIGGELQTQNWDDFNAAVLGGVWSTAVNVTSSVSVTAPGTITGTGMGALAEGDPVTLSGFSNPANNGRFFVLTASATSLTVATRADLPFVTGSGGSLVCSGKRLYTGTNIQTFSIEKRFEDIGVYETYSGVTPSQLTVSMQPEKMVTLAYTMLGLMENDPGQSATPLATPTAAGTGSPYDSFNGSIICGTNVVGAVTGIDCTINTSRSVQAVVGSKFSPNIFAARMQVGGNLSSMFLNSTIYNLFKNETESQLGFIMNDPDGVNFQSIYFPRTKINAAGIDPGTTGPVIVTSTYRALLDQVLPTSICWFRSNLT